MTTDTQKRAARVERELRATRSRLVKAEAKVVELRRSVEAKRRELHALRPGRRVPRKASDMDPAVQAGHGNVERLRTVFASRRRLSQADAARAAGLTSGTTTWAVRALVAQGVIVDTGERVGASRVYRYVARSKRTKIEPGG